MTAFPQRLKKKKKLKNEQRHNFETLAAAMTISSFAFLYLVLNVNLRDHIQRLPVGSVNGKLNLLRFSDL